MGNQKQVKVIKKEKDLDNEPSATKAENTAKKGENIKREILQDVKEDENDKDLEPKMTEDNCFKIPNEENLRMLRSRKSVTKKETFSLPIEEDEHVKSEMLIDDVDIKKCPPSKGLDSEEIEDDLKAIKSTMKKKPLCTLDQIKDSIETESKEVNANNKKSSAKKNIKKNKDINKEIKDDISETRKS